MNIKRICEDCVFYEKNGATSIAICRRYAPRAQTRLDFDGVNPDNPHWSGEVTWPAVEGDRDWCGEFESRQDNSCELPLALLSSHIRRFLRIREKKGKPIRTVEQLLSLTTVEILRENTIGVQTLYQIEQLQKKLRGKFGSKREPLKADI